MIFNPEACHFNPAVLTCKGAKTDSCLTSQQAGALEKAFSGPKDSRGNQVYSAFPTTPDTFWAPGARSRVFYRAPDRIRGVRASVCELDIDKLVARLRQ